RQVPAGRRETLRRAVNAASDMGRSVKISAVAGLAHGAAAALSRTARGPGFAAAAFPVFHSRSGLFDIAGFEQFHQGRPVERLFRQLGGLARAEKKFLPAGQRNAQGLIGLIDNVHNRKFEAARYHGHIPRRAFNPQTRQMNSKEQFQRH
ncbi:MAG: hypothetical protein ACI9VS_002162, partial [Candidatus Binatia bacterium]